MKYRPQYYKYYGQLTHIWTRYPRIYYLKWSNNINYQWYSYTSQLSTHNVILNKNKDIKMLFAHNLWYFDYHRGLHFDNYHSNSSVIQLAHLRWFPIKFQIKSWFFPHNFPVDSKCYWQIIDFHPIECINNFVYFQCIFDIHCLLWSHKFIRNRLHWKSSHHLSQLSYNYNLRHIGLRVGYLDILMSYYLKFDI